MANNIQDTENIQNSIGRMQREMRLNVENPTTKIKKQYAKCKKIMIDLNLALDMLNDEKVKIKAL